MASYNEKSTDYAVNISSNDLDEEPSAMEIRRYATKETYCDPCNRDGKWNKTAGYCVDCEEHLCFSCFNFHKKFKLLQHHVLLDKIRMLESKISEKANDMCVDKCPTHENRFIEYICQSCDKLCCSVCIIKDHRKCDSVDSILDIIEDIKKSKVYLDINKAIEDQSSSLTEHGRNCKVNQYKSRKLRDSAKEDVKMKCEEVHTWLIEREKEMMRKIETIFNEEQQRFGHVSSEVTTLEDDLEQIKSSLSNMKNLCQKSQLSVTLQKAKLTTFRIHRRLQELEKVETVKNYRFKEAANIRNIKSQELGTIEKTSSDTERKIKFLYSIDTVGGYSGKMCMISEKILLLRTRFLITLSLDPGKKEEPFLFQVDLTALAADFTKVSEREVAVTFPTDGVITFYDVTPTGCVAEKKSVHLGKRCHGIQYFKKNLIVSYCHSHSGSISIMDMSGQLKREIVGSSKLVFQSPLSLALNIRNEILYVADSSDNTVTSLTLDGKVINKSKPAITGLHGISTDENGSVYAFYLCNPNIFQFSEKCSLVKVLEIKDNVHLHAVFSEKNNLMYASTFEGGIDVFEII